MASTYLNNTVPCHRLIPAICLSLILLVSCSFPESETPLAGTPCEESTDELSVFFSGDSIITRSWSDVEDSAFIELVGAIRGTDAAFTNLETVIHEFKGYPQANSGGIHLASSPAIARELTWAGFDMVSHANNHTFDYGSTGVLETIEHVSKAGLVLAGSGQDLQSARAPAFFKTPNGTVALVATASTYIPYGRASRSRPDLHGRPGLNPLKVSWKKVLPYTGPITVTVPTKARMDPEDLEGNLDAIRAAKARADIVVFSIHEHGKGRWLPPLARQVIDAGADVFIAHGPHRIHGIEIYNCRPIFYGLGDFVYEAQHVKRVPAESYERYGLAGDATWDDLLKRRENAGLWSHYKTREVWEGLGAVVRFGNNGATEIRLLPVDLGFGEPIAVRGRPRLANPNLGRKIIGDVIQQSEPFGTKIEYREPENIGILQID